MTNQHLEQRLSQQREQVAAFQVNLEILAGQFIEACKPFIRDEIDKRARKAISSNPAKATELGAEGLKPIKQKVDAIIASSDARVQSVLEKDHLWLHRQKELATEKFPVLSYEGYGNRNPGRLETPVESLLASLGKILVSEGIDTTNNWDKTSFIPLHQVINWSVPMKEIIVAYSGQFDDLCRAVSNLEQLEKEKKSSEAASLWDSV